MGLFIGASILTILELFDYIYEVRCGIACGGPPGALIPPRCPEPEHGAGRARPPSTQGRLPSLCMDTVCPCAPGTGAGWVRDGSRRPVLGAVYTRTQGAGGMRRGDETVQGPAQSPWASCGASHLGVSAPAHSHHTHHTLIAYAYTTHTHTHTHHMLIAYTYTPHTHTPHAYSIRIHKTHTHPPHMLIAYTYTTYTHTYPTPSTHTPHAYSICIHNICTHHTLIACTYTTYTHTPRL